MQYITQGAAVQLKCEVRASRSNMLPDDVRITWYDGFIPIPATKEVYVINEYQVHQIIVNISVTGWMQFGRYVCKIEDNNGLVTMKSIAVVPEGMCNDNTRCMVFIDCKWFHACVN